MQTTLRRWSTFLLLLGILDVKLGVPCEAQTQQPTLCCSGDLQIGPTTGQAVAALIGAGAVVGTGVYFLARASRRSGCVVEEGGVLRLQEAFSTEPGYVLEGQVGSLTPGRRVKVIGRKHHDAQHREVLRVSRVAKEYGPCIATAGPRP